MVAASGSCTGRIPASALQPPGGPTRRPHRAGGGFQAGGAMAGSGHGPLSCGAPDRSAVVPETSPAAFDRLFARAADCSQGNSPCRHKGSPFLHFALPDPAPDRKHQPLSARKGWSSMALVDRRLSTPPAMTGEPLIIRRATVSRDGLPVRRRHGPDLRSPASAGAQVFALFPHR